MGLITDQLVMDAVRACGTATPPMIYDWIQERVVASRDIISSRAGKKLRQLVKYDLIKKMDFEKRTWYYMPDTVPNPIPLSPMYGADRIRDCVKNLPNGGVITLDKATAIGGCTKAHARKVLAKMPTVEHYLMNTYCKVGM